MDLLSNDFYQEFYFKQGLNFNQIGKKFNISKVKVRYYFYKNNLIPRIKIGAWNSGLTYKDDDRILSGKNHPRWKDSSKYYIDFKLKRREIINGETKCERCGVVAKVLHHKDRDKNNNSNDNLQPLCSSCHTTIHNIERGHFTYKHNCEWCGNEFIVLNHHNCKQRCCSLSCKSKLAYKEGKSLTNTRNGRAKYQHKCPNCNIDFVNNNPKQKYCSNECKHSGRKSNL